MRSRALYTHRGMIDASTHLGECHGINDGVDSGQGQEVPRCVDQQSTILEPRRILYAPVAHAVLIAVEAIRD